MKKAIVSVINDLSTDQRVHKTATTLAQMGFQVTLVGRKQRKSIPLPTRDYATKRLFLLFESGPLFYAEYQIRLFWYLLFHKADILVANDLDTLLPNFLISKIKRGNLVYDTHELFCEVPELQHTPLKKNMWKSLEKWIFPKLKTVITVNDSIANIYSKKYNVPVKVVRNIPMKKGTTLNHISKAELHLPADKKIIVLQGAGINIDRGAEEAVLAMQYVNDAILLIIGSGDVMAILKQLVNTHRLETKVFFTGKVPLEKLLQYTQYADLGLTLDKDTNINYRYSLPNKLFDYIHSNVPVLASNLIEVKKIIDHYQVGTCIENHDPQHIANKINSMLADEMNLKRWKENTQKAAQELSWDKEKVILNEAFTSFL